ncbi:N,N-dimethylformamidase large subunit [Aquincola sp. S2]|uniref:N,N-dimethylformamidase large subunit n=1 Tax=Pseudaquabacterium terrae TaxID=2732868 RepID=A0ABX2EGM8_9BURK|nr:N,N-dimethylformamidase beta subunit family domain-containing protein [Aquabacterium terrae]NRF67753.1 N,N-dimethylformamidase large subunit [Aquabacterium terrae]
MIFITGYSDRLSACAGESIAFKVSSLSSRPYRAKLVRIAHADPNPAGPGFKVEPLAEVFATERPSVAQPLRSGSCGRVARMPLVGLGGGLSVSVRIMPTAPSRGEQCVLSHGDPASGGWRLAIDGAGVLFTIAGAPAPVQLRCDLPLPARWLELQLSADPVVGTLTLQVSDVDTMAEGALRLASTARWRVPPQPNLAADADLLIGACLGDDGVPRCHFNGRIEAPTISAAAQAHHPSRIMAAWDFARGIDTADIVDTGPHQRHGRLINLPTRAVAGSRWTGREHCWRHAPEQYAAIHFHDDDLHDAGWTTGFQFTVPQTLKSGAYAMLLEAEGQRDWLPFYVTPAPGTSSGARIAFVAPTYTYVAYANYARGNFDAALRRRVADWQAYPHNPDEHPEVGRSTYNLHPDGSGVCFSSRWRPLLTMRPGFLTFDDPRGSGVRHYTADSHLLDWLEHEGMAFDVWTDDELERHGSAVLEPYAVVLTGTHPEYHSTRTLDALQGYLRSGGNLAYLGGNGFYWRVGLSQTVPGVLEVRRAGGGTRAWAPCAGENVHALDGELGGLWRSSGRTPQQLTGVGFVSQGPFEGAVYRVNDAARNGRAGWLLEGVASGPIGGYGLSGGGAAGFELDATSAADGTPAGTQVLARSEGHGPGFGPALDAVLSHTMTRDRGAVEPSIRAEITYRDTAWGGSVFTVGSITFCGSLSHDGYRNDMSTLLRNYLVRKTMPRSSAG